MAAADIPTWTEQSIRTMASCDNLFGITALVLPDDMRPWSGFFDPFMKLIDQGTNPAVVLQSRSTDAAYLAARGIDRLITLDQV